MREKLGWIIAGLLLIVAFAPFAVAQSSQWFGAPGYPFWYKTWQGSDMKFGTVTCDDDGETFLVSSSTYRQSLMIRNKSTETVYICPVGATNCDSKSNAVANAMFLNQNDALILDKSNRAASNTGWKCWTNTGTADIRYLAEEGY